MVVGVLRVGTSSKTRSSGSALVPQAATTSAPFSDKHATSAGKDSDKHACAGAPLRIATGWTAISLSVSLFVSSSLLNGVSLFSFSCWSFFSLHLSLSHSLTLSLSHSLFFLNLSHSLCGQTLNYDGLLSVWFNDEDCLAYVRDAYFLNR